MVELRNQNPEPVRHPHEKVEATPNSKDVKAPSPIKQTIPDGAIDPNDLKPGYGPLEGSPKENDPTKLFNPNNPNSPITKPANPSNPANMPQTQSEKPASEVAIYNELQAKATPKLTPEQEKIKADKAKAKKDLYDKISKVLADHDNRESSIPSNSEYWALVNQARMVD